MGQPEIGRYLSVSSKYRTDTVIRGPGLSQGAMAKGTVDFFNDTGGYGFIDTEDADEDVFFHMEDIGGPDLEEGQELEFDIEQADKGPRANNVERL
jgi:CspA family cold shock protein